MELVLLCRVEARFTFASEYPAGYEYTPPATPPQSAVKPGKSAPAATKPLTPPVDVHESAASAGAPRTYSHSVTLTLSPPGGAEAATGAPASTRVDGDDSAPARLQPHADASCASVVHVHEALVRGLVPACRLKLSAACERTAFHADAPTAPTAAVPAAKDNAAVKGGAAGSTASAGAPSAQPLGTISFSVDIAELLVGDTSVQCTVPIVAIQDAPVALQGLQVTVRCLQHDESAHDDASTPPQTPPAAMPTPLLPPQLRRKLAPIVLRFQEVSDLPDAPATVAQIASQCKPCTLRHKLPTMPDWQTAQPESKPSHWTSATTPLDAADPPLRKRSVAFGGSRVLLAADLELPHFVDACGHTRLEVEARRFRSAP